ncbi:hypothetical protein D3C73_873120 [compost metagenome]
MDDVIPSAQCRQYIVRKLILCNRFGIVILLLYFWIFTSRCFEIEFTDNKAEAKIVNDCENQTDDNDIPPWGASRNNPKDHKVDQTAGKCHPDFCAQQMHCHKRQAGKYAVNGKQYRCNKQEREL